MKTLFVLAALAFASCKESKPAVEASAPPAAAAAQPQKMEPNQAMKYITGLQADVKRAEEAKAKADAANKRALEAGKLPE